MSDYTPDEPQNHHMEIVDVGTWFRSTPDVTITYTPKSGQYLLELHLLAEEFQLCLQFS